MNGVWPFLAHLSLIYPMANGDTNRPQTVIPMAVVYVSNAAEQDVQALPADVLLRRSERDIQRLIQRLAPFMRPLELIVGF